MREMAHVEIVIADHHCLLAAQMAVAVLLALLGLITVVILRLFVVLRGSRPRPSSPNAKKTLGVFLGSGKSASHQIGWPLNVL